MVPRSLVMLAAVWTNNASMSSQPAGSDFRLDVLVVLAYLSWPESRAWRLADGVLAAQVARAG